jgi:hypothetical protein
MTRDELLQRQREALYKAGILRLSLKILREHIAPRTQAEAEHKETAATAMEAVIRHFSAWKFAEEGEVQRFTDMLGWDKVPEKWDFPLHLLH